MRSASVTCVIVMAGEKQNLEAMKHSSVVMMSPVTAAIASIVYTIPLGHVEHLYREGRHLQRARALSTLVPVDLQEGKSEEPIVPSVNGSTRWRCSRRQSTC